MDLLTRILPLAGLLWLSIATAQNSVWLETFDSQAIDTDAWSFHREGDFREALADIGAPSPEGAAQLRLRADTIGTDDSTVKYLGIHTKNSFPISGKGAVSLDLDWNNPSNGSYFSAAMILSPDKTESNPLNGPDWLSIEYVGVPPGQNARLLIRLNSDGRQFTLFTDGWPDENRAGRKISVQNIAAVFDGQAFKVFENGQLRYDSKAPMLTFDDAHIYLQISSHSNYEGREVFFDNLRVTLH